MRGVKTVLPTPTLALALAMVLTLGLCATVQAEDYINQSFFTGVAIDGYDPVAYFTKSVPVEGSETYEYDWKGATWRFATPEHLEMFKTAPEKYAPQYGGYCAWAVAQGETADIEPDVWKIVDGKLYLNYDEDVQAKWEYDIPGNIKKADANWPAVLD